MTDLLTPDTNRSIHRWLYGLILTIDANFRLKLKDKGSKNDGALGDGWAYWVPEQEYQDYIAKYGHQTEVRRIPSFTVQVYE